MSKETENQSLKALGLDIGTSRIVAAQRVQSEYRFDSQLNAFVTVPYSKFTHKVFQKEGVPHRVDGAEMLVIGNESEKLANMCNRKTRRPMVRGLLNPDEPESLGIVKQIICSLVGDGSHRGQRLCFSVPGPPLGGSRELAYHEATLRQVLGELGFDVITVNEGLAVVLAELEDSSYTGIGVSCGGGMCNICLAYLSLPVFSFSIPKAGDFIDASAAAVTGENPTRIRTIKEASFHFNGHFADKVQQALGVYYDEMIRGLTGGIKEAFAQTRNIPRIERPLPLVISGGSTLPAGFRERFEHFMNEARLPVAISEVRLAADPLRSTAKGALISALAA